MRSAVTISIALHILITLIATNWVSFRQVDYVPRQVYNVTLVTPAIAEPQQQKKVEAPVVEPEPVPEPEPEPEEEMPPPPDKPKPPPKKKPEPKKPPVQTTEIEKTQPQPEPGEAAETAPETGQVSLDTDDFPFAYYISRMRRKIAANWRVPAGTVEERGCRIYFRVHRDGSVSDVGVEESSGLYMFDQAAQRAVLQAAPMPPLPREYGDDYLGVHFSFAFREKR